jgi:sulfhydrogenase subunit delta
MKPTVGIFGLTGCAGDQLVVLNCEDELLDLVSLLDIREFLTASSEGDHSAALDVALVEGAVLSARDERRLREIRERSSILVALGTCAVHGGVAVLDRLAGPREKLLTDVYGPAGMNFDTQPARALHEVVPVDVNITGCPIEKHELLYAIGCLLNGDVPVFPDYSVCTECRNSENRCMLLDERQLCCGALTAAGCRARCPSLGVACVGCRGPVADSNFASALSMYEGLGFTPDQVRTRLATFAPTMTAVP